MNDTAFLTSTFRPGMAGFVLAIFLALWLLACMELICEVMDWPSIGYRVQGWSRDNPPYVATLLVVLGALLAHFLWNPIT